MRRGDFEDLVRRHLDGELIPRGFELTPQPPADWDDENPAAVYEADPKEFGKRYPALAPYEGSDSRCIDLWVHLDQSTGMVASELEGPSVEFHMERLGVKDAPGSSPAPMDTESQLKRLARRLGAILDAASRS